MHRVSSSGNTAIAARPRKEKRVTYIVGDSRSGKHCSGINSVVISSGQQEHKGHGEAGYVFTGSRDGTVKRWNLVNASSVCDATFESHVDWVNDVALVGTSTLVSCSSDSTLKVWEAFSNGECRKTLRQHADYVTRVAAAREKPPVLASAGLSCEVFIWDIEAAMVPVVRAPPDSPGESAAVPGPPRSSEPMGVYRSPSAGSLSGGSAAAAANHLSPGGRGMHAMGNGTLGGVSSSSLARGMSPPEPGASSQAYYAPVPCLGHKESVYSLAINDVGTVVVSGGTEKAIRVWDPRTGVKTMKLKGHTDNIRALLLDPSGTKCLSGSSDSIIRLWDLGMRRCIHSYAVHMDSVWALAAASSFNVVYSGGRDKAVYKTDLSSCETVLLCQEQSPILSLALANEPGSSEALWVSTTGSSLRLWPATDERPGDPDAHNRSAFVASPLPFARVRASLDGSVASLPLHSQPLACSPGAAGIVQHSILNDKRHVLTKDADGIVKLWEVTRGEVVKTFGKVSFEEKDKELFEQVSVPSWFSLDTRLGSISVHLETPNCFAAEMYATDLNVPGVSEELKLNLGQHTLRGLFQHWATRCRQRAEAQLKRSSCELPMEDAMEVDQQRAEGEEAAPQGLKKKGGGEGGGRDSSGNAGPAKGDGDVTVSNAPDPLEGTLPAFDFSTVQPPSIVTEGSEGGPWRRAATELDGTEDERSIPLWCMECVLHNRLPPREPAKCSFHLQPYENSGLKSLTLGKLSAPRILRIQKVMNYVQERLMQDWGAEGSEYSEGGGASPSPASLHPNGNGHANGPPRGWSASSSSSRHSFEIICNDQVLAPEMSLASVRTYVWKRPDDLILFYRQAQQ